MTEGICSKCHQNFFNCSCEYFHPNLEGGLVIGPIEVGRLQLDEEQIILQQSRQFLLIDKKEATALYEYFLKRAGYISYETDEEVHKFINRLREFLV